MGVDTTCNCLTWDQVFYAWKNANWRWNVCATKICTWGKTFLQWNLVYWDWKDCELIGECIQEIIKIEQNLGSGALDPQQVIDPWLDEPWDPYKSQKKKRLIQLLCKIRGISQKNTEKLIKENIKVTVRDIKLIIESAKNISIEIDKLG